MPTLDSDGDGVPNWLEYQRGTDPFNRDSDGDGIADGAEKKNPGYSGGSRQPRGGCEPCRCSPPTAAGMTLELLTKSFDVTPVAVGGQAFERLRVPAYVHGFTLEPGLPQVPLKGILLDVPAGKQARVEVLDAAEPGACRATGSTRRRCYQAGANNQVAEVFSWDEAAYREQRLLPGGGGGAFQRVRVPGPGEAAADLLPLRFNPGTGELLHSERIRVRVEFSRHRRQPRRRARGRGRGGCQAPAAATGWSIPAGAAYKVSTDGEGIYRITRDWLHGARHRGCGDRRDRSRPGCSCSTWGRSRRSTSTTQNGNNRLDAGDYISFYATAVPAAYAKYARYNVYWLIDAGSASPLRMASIDGAPSGAPLAVSHASTVHYELDQGYLQNSPGPDGMDRWLFPAVALGPGFAGGGTAKSFTLTLSGVAAAGELAHPPVQPLRHGARGGGRAERRQPGQRHLEREPGSRRRAFTGVSLLEGANTVAITCEVGADKIYFDWFEADYERSFAAAADSLKFTHAGGLPLPDRRLQHERMWSSSTSAMPPR